MINEIIAFSGPGAGARIQANINIGYICAAGTLALLLFTYFMYHCERIKAGWLVKFLFISFLLHPAWTLSARSGDGGIMKVNISFFILVVAVLALLIEFLIEQNRKRDIT